MMDINFGLEHEVVTNGGALPAMSQQIVIIQCVSRLLRPSRLQNGRVLTHYFGS